MEYNKAKFNKAADKKVLHKVKKQWIVLSTALLMAVAGGATMLGGTSANADTANNTGNSNTQTSSTNTIKNRLNASLTKSYQQNHQNNAQSSVNNHQQSTKSISNQANALHNRILANATANQSRNTMNGRTQNTQTSHNGQSVLQDRIAQTSRQFAAAAPQVKNSASAQSMGQSSALATANNVATGKEINVNDRAFGSAADSYAAVPVTIAYVNSDNSFQMVKSDNGDAGGNDSTLRSNVGIGYLQYDTTKNSGYSLSYDSNTYSLATPFSSLKGNYNNGSMSWSAPTNKASDTSETSGNVQDDSGSANYGTQVASGANWDSVYGRPLIVLKANNAAGAQDDATGHTDNDIIVNYVNQAGKTINDSRNNYQWGKMNNSNDTNSTNVIHGLKGQLGNVVNVLSDVKNPDPHDYTPVDNFLNNSANNVKNLYTVKNGPQEVTVPVMGQSFAENDSNADGGNNKFTVTVQYRDHKNQKAGYFNISKYLKASIGSYAHVSPTDVAQWVHDYLHDPNHDNISVSNGTGQGETSGQNSDQLVNDFDTYSNVDPADSNATKTIYFKGNGDGKAIMVNSDTDSSSTTDNNSASFTFDANAKNGSTKGFTVQYMDAQTNQSVGSVQFSDNNSNIVNHYGQSFNILSAVPNKIDGQNNSSNKPASLPNGYLLVPGQNTNHIVSSNGSTVYLYVNGAQKTTNANGYPKLTVTLNAKVLNADGSPASSGKQINTQYGTSTVGDNGQISITTSDFDPNMSNDQGLTGYVGQSDTLDAADFTPQVSQAAVQLADGSQAQDKVAFGPSSTNPTSVSFNYDIYLNPSSSTRHHIYVHYVTASDVQHGILSDVSTIYKKGQPYSDVQTTVSDSGTDGTAFDGSTGNVNEVTKNVPEGYQIVRGNESGNNVNGANQNGIVGTYSNLKGSDNHTIGNNARWNTIDHNGVISQFTNSDQNEVVEVAPIVQGVTVKYIDQAGKDVTTGDKINGRTIKTVQIPGLNKSNITRAGETMNFVGKNPNEVKSSITNSSISGDDSANPSNGDNIFDAYVPNGYHVTQETTNYTFNQPGNPNNEPEYDVMVAGNKDKQDSASDTARIHIVEEDPQGNVMPDKGYTVSDNIDGDIDDTYTINANSFTPNGFTPAPVGQSASGYIENGGISNNNIYFYYKKNVDRNINNIKPIYVTYSDDGKEVGMNTISPKNSGGYSDYDGELVDVTKRGNDGYKLPYALDGDQYQLNSGDNTISKFSDTQPNYLNLKVHDPKSDVSGTVTIIQNMYQNHDGSGYHNLVGEKHQTVNETGKKDTPNAFTIYGRDYNDINGFKESTGNTDGTGLNAQGGFTGSGVTPQVVILNYTATNSSNDSDSGPGPNNNKPSGGTPGQNDPNNGHRIPGNPYTPGVTPHEHKAMPIYVSFVDPNVHQNHGIIDPKDGVSDTRVDGYMGQTYSDIASTAMDRNGQTGLAPNGYHLENGQNLSYQIGDQERQVVLYVNKAESNENIITINSIEEDNHGNNLNGGDPVQSRDFVLSDNTSDTIYPENYNPNTGDFSIDTSKDHQIHYSDRNGVLYKNGAINGDHTKDTDSYYYEAKTDPADKNLKPINVTYWDQNGHQVGQKTYPVTAGAEYDGEQVDISHDLPNGYSWDTNYPNTSLKQKAKYNYGDTTQNINAFVSANPLSGLNFTVKWNLIKSDGSTVNYSSGMSDTGYGSNGTFQYNGQNKTGLNDYARPGDSDTLTADDVLQNGGDVGKIDVNGTYKPDSELPDDQTDNIHFNNNSTTSPTSDQFTYVAQPQNPSKTGMLIVHYLTKSGKYKGTGYVAGGQNNGQEIDDITNGGPHDQLSNIAPGYKAVSDNVPSANRINGKQYGYKFTQTGQNEDVNVTVESNNEVQSSNPLTIIRLVKDANGQTYQAKDQNNSDIKTYLQGHLDSDITVDPANYTPTVDPATNKPSNYTVDPNTDDARIFMNSSKWISPDTVVFYYDQTTNKNAAPMIVRYFNEKGVQVGSGTISGNNNFGRSLDVTQNATYNSDHFNHSKINGYGVQTGYNIDSDPAQRTVYTFDRTEHVINLNVHGNSANNQITVHVHKNGGGPDLVRHVQDNHEVGSDMNLMPNDYAPRGYHATLSDKDAKIWTNPDGSVTTNNVYFNYDENDAQAAPLKLVYINQASNQVGSTDTISGNLDQVVNVADPSDGGESVPAGYQLAGGTGAADNKTTDGKGQPAHHPNAKLGNTQNLDYGLTRQNQTIYLRVKGNGSQSVTGTVKIYKNIYQADGSETTQVSNWHPTKNLAGSDIAIGDTFKVTASDVNPDSSKYHPTGDDQEQFGQVNANGSVAPNELTFNYAAGGTSNGSHTGYATVHYVGPNNSQIGPTYVLNGIWGQSIKINNSSANSASDDPVPAGYRTTGDTNGYTFSNDNQDIYIPVEGEQLSQPAEVTVYGLEKNSDGSQVLNTKEYHVVLSDNNSEIGGSGTFTPYDKLAPVYNTAGNPGSGQKTDAEGNYLWQINSGGSTGYVDSGYHATASDASANVKVNANGKVSPFNTITYSYEKDYQSTSVGTIKVDYYTGNSVSDAIKNNGAGQNGSKVLDSVEDHGIAGTDQFHVEPYYDDLPNSINNDYYATGSVYDDSKSNKISNPGSNNTTLGYNSGRNDSNPYTIYIQVSNND